MRSIPEEGRGFEPGQKVKLMIASRSKLGFKAVINNGHLGLIFNEDVFQPLRIGQQLNGYIKSVRTDGKLDLVLQPSSDDAGEQLESRILAHLERHRGVSRSTDKSLPELIYKTFKASKAGFKRALGRLYKKRRILIEKNQVRLSGD